MTEKFTPGPWKVYKNRVIEHEYFIDKPHVKGAKTDHEIGFAYKKADAILMSAAPEMYQALIKAKETIRAWHDIGAPVASKRVWQLYQDSPEMKVINDAIAKAEGKGGGKQQ